MSVECPATWHSPDAPWGVLIEIIFRIRVNAFTACSALLLFHGTPSCSRNVNNFPRFFSSRFFSAEAASVTQVMQETESSLLAVWRGLRPANPCLRLRLAPPGMFLGSAGKGRFLVPA